MLTESNQGQETLHPRGQTLPPSRQNLLSDSLIVWLPKEKKRILLPQLGGVRSRKMGFRSGAKRCTYEATASPSGGRSSLAAENFPRVRFHRNGCWGKGPCRTGFHGDMA